MDKWLNEFTDNRIFMKLVALVLALLLFGSVYDPNLGKNDVNVPGDEEKVTITDIPVKSYYDTDNLIVTGVPETVEVTLDGPTPNLQQAKTQKDFEVFVDLTDASVGKQRVRLQIRDLSDKLSATINPVYVEVNVQEKVTKEFSVDVEFDEKMVAEDFEAGTPVVEPNKVKITAGKDVMEQITYVKANVNVDEPVDKTINASAPITVLDKDLNKLNVLLEKETVKVSIPVKRSSKTVPIAIVEMGTPPTGVTIESITLDTNQASIKGSEDVLNKTENVRVEVDVSTIMKDTELTLPVIFSDGITESNPKTVKAAIRVTVDTEETAKVGETGTKVFSNLPINFSGLSDKYNIAIRSPSSGKTTLTVTGTNDDLAKIKDTDFQLSINVGDLNEGEHEVPLNIKGPNNVSWTAAVESVSIALTPKEVS